MRRRYIKKRKYKKKKVYGKGRALNNFIKGGLKFY